MKKSIILLILLFLLLSGNKVQAQGLQLDNLDQLQKKIDDINKTQGRAINRLNEFSRLINGHNAFYGSSPASKLRKELKTIEIRKRSQDMKLNQLNALTELNAKENDFLKILRRNKQIEKLIGKL